MYISPNGDIIMDIVVISIYIIYYKPLNIFFSFSVQLFNVLSNHSPALFTIFSNKSAIPLKKKTDYPHYR